MKDFFRKLFKPLPEEIEKQSLPRQPMDIPDDAYWKELALDELQRLAEIIARHEKHAFTVKAFLAAVITGLATMVYSRDSAGAVMSSWEFGSLGIGAVGAFWIWATAHRVLSVRAINRTTEVEYELSAIKKLTAYRGPRVTKAMNPPFKWYSKESIVFFVTRGFYITHILPFGIAILAVAILTWSYDTKIKEQYRKDQAALKSDTVIRDKTFPDIKGYGKCQALFKVEKQSDEKNATKLVLDSVSCDM